MKYVTMTSADYDYETNQHRKAGHREGIDDLVHFLRVAITGSTESLRRRISERFEPISEYDVEFIFSLVESYKEAIKKTQGEVNLESREEVIMVTVAKIKNNLDDIQEVVLSGIQRGTTTSSEALMLSLLHIQALLLIELLERLTPQEASATLPQSSPADAEQ